MYNGLLFLYFFIWAIRMNILTNGWWLYFVHPIDYYLVIYICVKWRGSSIFRSNNGQLYYIKFAISCMHKNSRMCIIMIIFNWTRAIVTYLCKLSNLEKNSIKHIQYKLCLISLYTYWIKMRLFLTFSYGKSKVLDFC